MGDVENMISQSIYSPMKAVPITSIDELYRFIKSFRDEGFSEAEFKYLYEKFFLQEMKASWDNGYELIEEKVNGLVIKSNRIHS